MESHKYAHKGKKYPAKLDFVLSSLIRALHYFFSRYLVLVQNDDESDADARGWASSEGSDR